MTAQAFYDTDTTALKMSENCIKINETGVWIKTASRQVRRVRRCITEGLKDMFGYSLLQEAEFNQFVDMTFKKGEEILAVRCFRDGRVQLTTKKVRNLFETIIPHVENTLNIRFRGDRIRNWNGEIALLIFVMVFTIIFVALYYGLLKEFDFETIWGEQDFVESSDPPERPPEQ